MKKHVIISFSTCLILIFLSGLYLYRKYTNQVEAQKELMVWYVSDVKSKLEIIKMCAKELSHTVRPMFDKDDKLNEDVISKYAENILALEQFYIDNNYFVNDISVYDKYGRVFDLHRDKGGEFIRDTYESRIINTLRSEMGILAFNNSFSIIVPVYHGVFLAGNVAINLDLMSMQQEVYKPYFISGHLWPTTILDEETLLTLPLEDEWVLSCEKEILLGIQERRSGFLPGDIKGFESSARVVTYFESLPIPEHYLGIAFSKNISPLVISSLLTFLVVLLILTAIATGSSLLLTRMIAKNRETISKKDKTINVLQIIYDNSPVAFYVSRNNTFFTANNHFFKVFKGFASLDDARNMNLPFKVQQEFKEWTLCKFEKIGKEKSLGKRQMSVELDDDIYTINAFWDVSEMELRVKDAIRSKIAKSELLNRVNSDVRKTLYNVNDTATLLLKQFPEEANIININKLTSSLSELVDTVQDYSDIESGQIQLDEIPFVLVDEIKKVTELHHSKIQQKGIELRVQIAASTIRNVVGDPYRFRQIINELLSNAVKFTNEGTIRISLETTELQGKRIMIKCSVEDTGEGIPKDKLKKLFSLDSLIKEKKDSIGLGIIIAQKLVILMGGSLRVTCPSSISTDPSAPGTWFSFSITCFSDRSFDKHLNYSSIVSYRQIHVLVVSSDVHHVQYLTNYLNRKGLRSDVFLYNKDTEDLLINKLIIDKNRYQIVMIATANSEMTFAIANEINQNGLTEHCLCVLIDTSGQKGNYIKAKSLNMDYYFIKNNDLSVYDALLKAHFPNLSDKDSSDEYVRKDLQILIADNNVLGQNVAVKIFQKLGYEADIASNALFLVNQMNHKKYDIIFMDLKFPPSDGFEIAEMLRTKDYQMPIIAVTSTLTKKNIKHITESGMNGYLPKPLDTEDVRKLLLQWFG